ncbi:MAG: N-acetylmuramoyl-L-alanine amidase [Eubacteriales bacterium]|nr:N-acetylmuramoyl-L-alanine amidase [Eubacteriales bacterium]
MKRKDDDIDILEFDEVEKTRKRKFEETDSGNKKYKKSKKRDVVRLDYIFGIATLIAVVVVSIMIYLDYGKVFGSLMASAKYESDISEEDYSEDNTEEESTTVKSSVVVCIDAPHGGSDTGQYNGTSYEKDQVLEIAKLVENNLTGSGVRVIMTRTTDTGVNYETRTKLCNTGKAVCLVSIHRDYSLKSGKSYGAEGWIHTNSPANSKGLATAILSEIENTGAVNSGVHTGTPDSAKQNYYLNQHSTGASCIVNLGNMYSTKDNEMITTNKEQTAKAISDGIIKYLGQAGYFNG